MTMPGVELHHCSQNEWRGKRVPRKLRLFCDRLKIPARISVSKPGTNEAELGLHPNRRNNDFLPDQSSESRRGSETAFAETQTGATVDRTALPPSRLLDSVVQGPPWGVISRLPVIHNARVRVA